MLTNVKIFQFLHSPCCISGQYVLCGKENLIAREYSRIKNIERKKGNTKWNFWKLFKYSIEGIVSFSTVPLFFSSILGFLICISASVWFIRIIIGYFLNGTSGDGFATLVCLLLIWGGVLLFAIGILGIYIARLYLEVKKRPLYIVKEEL